MYNNRTPRAAFFFKAVGRRWKMLPNPQHGWYSSCQRGSFEFFSAEFTRPWAGTISCVYVALLYLVLLVLFLTHMYSFLTFLLLDFGWMVGNGTCDLASCFVWLAEKFTWLALVAILARFLPQLVLLVCFWTQRRILLVNFPLVAWSFNLSHADHVLPTNVSF